MTKRTLYDFDEAYRYGTTLTEKELKTLEKLLKKLKDEFKGNKIIIQRLNEMERWFL